MVRKHAKREVFARGKSQPPRGEEADDPLGMRLFDLYLDEDGVFRWYEQDDAFEVTGLTLREAIASASAGLPSFQLYEVRGHTYVNSEPIPEIYAKDEMAGGRG